MNEGYANERTSEYMIGARTNEYGQNDRSFYTQVCYLCSEGYRLEVMTYICTSIIFLKLILNVLPVCLFQVM